MGPRFAVRDEPPPVSDEDSDFYNVPIVVGDRPIPVEMISQSQ